MSQFSSFPIGGVAVVVGSSGGIGGALVDLLAADGRFDPVVGLHRRGSPTVDLTDEASIREAASRLGALGRHLRLVVNAAGILQEPGLAPEKSWRSLDPIALARYFAVNATGPMVLMKHFLPLLSREGKAVLATLSARVGSIGDNRLGGWYGYRASKAALNQFVRTAAVELARQHREAICCALHPGTVDTRLSQPHAKQGLDVRSPSECATLLAGVLDSLTTSENGSFLDYNGAVIPW
jgi:NAD(P)-dependent dehydrogenase (short-subunit alcohol dehydrogenase family)